jgi:hypothetical protein
MDGACGQFQDNPAYHSGDDLLYLLKRRPLFGLRPGMDSAEKRKPLVRKFDSSIGH